MRALNAYSLVLSCLLAALSTELHAKSLCEMLTPEKLKSLQTFAKDFHPHRDIQKIIDAAGDNAYKNHVVANWNVLRSRLDGGEKIASTFSNQKMAATVLRKIPSEFSKWARGNPQAFDAFMSATNKNTGKPNGRVVIQVGLGDLKESLGYALENKGGSIRELKNLKKAQIVLVNRGNGIELLTAYPIP